MFAVSFPVCSAHGIAQSYDEADRLFHAITFGAIAKGDASDQLAGIIGFIRRDAQRTQSTWTEGAWVFPLRGQRRPACGQLNKGYLGERAYNFLDGNAHRGHPAFDLFIRDRNHDCLDDRTGKRIDVISVTDGIVLSTVREWSADSIDVHGHALRGGMCAWIYDPASDGIFYYAHLSSLSVQPGGRVPAGSVIGAVGRSGWNAARRRSSTHLHLMYLSLREGVPRPVNIASRLCTSSPGSR